MTIIWVEVSWSGSGGTSASSPMWAALVALTDQGRSANYSSYSAVAQLYNIATNNTNFANDFHDVATGSNGYASTGGWDPVTGIGSPIANNLTPQWVAAP